MEIKKDILWRVYLSFICIVALGFVVLGRTFFIQRVQGSYWRGMSDSLHQKFIEIDAERGTIYSEDGQMLSTSIPYFDVYMDFGAEGLRDNNGKRFKENLDSFSIALANYFNDSKDKNYKTSAEYKKELKKAYNEEDPYYLVRKNISFEEYKIFRSFPLAKLGRYKSGIIVETHTKRLNPYGVLARRTIGLSREHAQNVGLERTYDSLLKGTTGKRLVRFISGGAYVPVEGYEIDPENGRDIYTTLDINIQDITESALRKMLVESRSMYGTCIVMETKTGKIKAIANLGRDTSRRNSNDTIARYDEDLNYALRTTEPGSTIKLATLLSVLEMGSSKIDDQVEVGSSGSAWVGVRNVNDAERAPKPILTVRECFAHSSNVGMSKLALKAFGENPEQFKTYLHKFRLDKPTGIGLVGEETPILPKLKKTNEGIHAMLTMSFGYAIQVSPLNTIMLYNAIANDGKMMQPYLVSSIKNNGVAVRSFEPIVLDKQICRPDVVNAARRCMEAVVTEGTAKDVFKDFPFAVAGKTGTAHVADGKYGYDDGVYQASFVGYFPADHPEYTCIVLIKTEPHAPKHFGGQLAAPVFKEIATKVYATYVQRRKSAPLVVVPDSVGHSYGGYIPDIKNVLDAVNIRYKDSAKTSEMGVMNVAANSSTIKAREETPKKVPDVRNMTIREAVYILENLNIKVIIKGRGKVIMQDLAPGTPIAKGQFVTLLLN